MPSIREMRDVFDFEPIMAANCKKADYDYMAQGSSNEWTMRRNREMFDYIHLIPRRMVDVSSVNTATTLLGQQMAFPIMISPTAGHVRWNPDGEIATHRGATAANVTMILSQNTTIPMQKVFPAATGPMWFQIYPQPTSGDYNQKTLGQAQDLGAKSLVITVDQQASPYERAMHARNLTATPSMTAPGPPRTPATPPTGSMRYDVAPGRLFYTWQMIEDLKKLCKVPMIVKGIATGEDAELCIQHGVDAIFVSNHGGRSIDYGPSTIEILPEIVDAVKGRVPVILDSGDRKSVV